MLFNDPVLLGLGIFLVLAVAYSFVSDAICYFKCREVVLNLKASNPQIVEEARLDIFWAKGFKRRLYDYARFHEPTNDPDLEKLLADHLSFRKKIGIVSLIFLLLIVLISCLVPLLT